MGDQLSDRIAKCINLAQETLEHSGTPYIMAPDEYHQPEHLTGYLDRVNHSLLHCISVAQSTLGKDCGLSTAKPRITRLHYPSPNDLLGQVDRVDKTLLECINLAESTLNAEEQNTPKAKFNKEFDDCMKGLEPLSSGPTK